MPTFTKVFCKFCINILRGSLCSAYFSVKIETGVIGDGGCKVAINIEFEMKFRIICQLGKHLKLFSHFSPRFRFVSLGLAGTHKYNRVVENLCLRQDNTGQIMQISEGNASIFSITCTCIWYLIIFTGAAGHIHTYILICSTCRAQYL